MGVRSLADTIAKAITASKFKLDTAVKQGVIDGNSVLISGKSYRYDVGVDIEVLDGDAVYVLLNDDQTLAVVVGK